MGRQWPSDEVPDDLLVPKGTFHFEIGEIAEAWVNEKLVYKPDLTVTEPKAWKGKKLFGLTYWVGTDDDKKAADPETWKASRGVIDMKQLIQAAGVKPTNDVDADRAKAAGRIVGITVGKQARKNNPERVDNTAQMYWKAGSRALEIFSEDGAAVPKVQPPKMVAPKPAPVAPPPVDEDEEGGEETAPVRSTTAELPKPKPGKKADMRTCPKCKQEFARNVLVDHMKACIEDEEEEEED